MNIDKNIKSNRSAIKRSLSLKLLFYIFLASSLVTSLMTITMFYLDYSEEKHNFSVLEDNLRNNMSVGLSQAVWELNEQGIASQLKGISNIEDIINLKVLDETGEELQKILKESKSTIDETLVIDLKIKGRTSEASPKVGELHIDFTYENMYKRILKRVWIFFVSQLLKAFTLSTIILIIINKILTRHIINISSFLDNLDLNSTDKKNSLKLDRKESGDNTDELDLLVSKLKKMNSLIIESNKKKLENIKELEKSKDMAETQAMQSSKLASIGEVAAGIAHEINNPLSIINGYNSYIKTALQRKNFHEDEKMIARADKISIMIKRIKKIIDGMLIFARNDHTSETIETVLVGDILDEVSILYEQRIKMNSIEFQGPTDKERALRVLCKAIPVSQVIYNLISNAVDAIENLDEKWVRFEVKDLGHHVEFAVSDSGKGIPPETVKELFGAFYTTKPAGSGTGLGLSICKKIIEEHDSTLTVDQSCKNTRFVFTLPKDKREV